MDKKVGVGAALTGSFGLGKRNYGALLAIEFVAAVICLAGVLFTLGLGALIMVPFSLLVTAYMYRSLVPRG